MKMIAYNRSYLSRIYPAGPLLSRRFCYSSLLLLPPDITRLYFLFGYCPCYSSFTLRNSFRLVKLQSISCVWNGLSTRLFELPNPHRADVHELRSLQCIGFQIPSLYLLTCSPSSNKRSAATSSNLRIFADLHLLPSIFTQRSR